MLNNNKLGGPLGRQIPFVNFLFFELLLSMNFKNKELLKLNIK